MAIAVVSSAQGILRDLLMEEAKFLSGVSPQVKGLQTQLEELQCLLQDIDRRHQDSKIVRKWISELRDLAYRAEDVIEAYAVEVSSSRSGRGIKRKFFQIFPSVWSEAFTIGFHAIGSEISEIKCEIARVTNSMISYGIKSIIDGGEASSSTHHHHEIENRQWKRQTYPIETHQDCFVGMEDDLKRLVSLVVEDRENRVVSLWGMGGIGKTTIARKVFNHVKTRHFFESFAWVCITQQCHIRSILEDVLGQLAPHRKKEDIMNLSNCVMIQELARVQKEKRCMIVVDDLWEMDHWDSLKHAFTAIGVESKILLTTRNANIASVGFVHEIRVLKEDDAWTLLKNKAIQGINAKDSGVLEDESIKKIGKAMVRRCGYLPLVISVLGGFLRRRPLKEWEAINKNIASYLDKAEGLSVYDGIHGMLDLSYEDLPSYLKPCFLYMAHFKEDQSIPASDLYVLWISEGMISSENIGRGETLMDVAEGYLGELASRCLVHVEPETVVPNKRYRSCRLHDIVRELCLSKGKREDFRLEVKEYHHGEKYNILDESFSGLKSTRRLAIHFWGYDAQSVSREASKFPREETNVRSLQFLNHSSKRRVKFPSIAPYIKLFKLLRVIVFQRCGFEGRKLPDEIGNLIHLRCLRLRDCELDELPFSIGNLTYLYTLDLLNSRNVKIPNILKTMRRLKHLILPVYDRQIDVRKYRLSLDGLDELETLSGFNSRVHDLKYISKMKNLRYLSGTVHENKSLSAIIDGINENWTNLRECRLCISGDCTMMKKVFMCPTLHQLIISTARIKSLSTECEPQTVFRSLVKLYLKECSLTDDPMETLEKLPCLQELYVLQRSYTGEEMTCRGEGFPQLTVLVLYQLQNLKKWKVEKGGMPRLSSVKFHACLQLRMIPDGFRFITSLRELLIVDMSMLGRRVSASVKDGAGGEDFDKVRHVPCISIIR